MDQVVRQRFQKARVPGSGQILVLPVWVEFPTVGREVIRDLDLEIRSLDSVSRHDL